MAAPERFSAAWEAIEAGVDMCDHGFPDALGPTGLPLCPTCRTTTADLTARLEAIRPPLIDAPALAAGEVQSDPNIPSSPPRRSS